MGCYYSAVYLRYSLVHITRNRWCAQHACILPSYACILGCRIFRLFTCDIYFLRNTKLTGLLGIPKHIWKFLFCVFILRNLCNIKVMSHYSVYSFLKVFVYSYSPMGVWSQYVVRPLEWEWRCTRYLSARLSKSETRRSRERFLSTTSPSCILLFIVWPFYFTQILFTQ